MTATLWGCVTLSGAAALALELLWMRSAALVLGGTAATASAVLAWYFAGLGMGAALARRPPARPVRRYAFLEIGVALGAAWSVVVFDALGDWGGLAGVGALAVAILPATLCLGATLPALGQALAGPGMAGRRGAAIYALNTLGGVIGVVTMGFGLPALIGVRASYGVAIGASALAGVLALGVSRRARGRRPSARPAAALLPRRRLRAVALAAGALGLGLEVLWVRLFAQVLHNSVYSFAAVSLVVLLALAAGAALAAVLLRRSRPASVAATALLLAAVGTTGGLSLFVWLTDGLDYVGMRSGLGEYVLRIAGLVAATAGPAALASGVVLPALWAAFGDHDGAARPIGDLAAANTLGGVAGALLAGFVVLPMAGLRGGFMMASAVYLGLALAIAPDRRWTLGAAATVAAALLASGATPLAYLRRGETLRARIEGPSGIVTVVDTEDDRQLRLDNHYLLGGSAAAATERRLGLVPLLLHPAPRRVAFVGMATGISASAGPALGVEQTTVVELVPEVAAAAGAHFAPWNAGLLDRPDVQLVVDDGRHHLATTAARYDVIVGDLFVPWHAGAGNLWTYEAFTTAAARLAPGGLYCQWLPLYQLTREEFDVIARTFLAVFPHVSIWRDDFYADRPVVGLVGSAAPLAWDEVALQRRLDAIPEWGRESLLATARGLAMLSLGDLSSASDVLPPGVLNTDDRPVIEFLAPRLTRMGPDGDKDWFTGAPLVEFASALADRTPDGDAEGRQAGLALQRWALAARGGDVAAAARLREEVRLRVPEVVAGVDREPAMLADARRTLAALREEAGRVRSEIETAERRLREMSRAEAGR